VREAVYLFGEGTVDLVHLFDPLSLPGKEGREVFNMGFEIGILNDRTVGKVVLPGGIEREQLYSALQPEIIQELPYPAPFPASPDGLDRQVEGKAFTLERGAAPPYLGPPFKDDHPQPLAGEELTAHQPPQPGANNNHIVVHFLVDKIATPLLLPAFSLHGKPNGPLLAILIRAKLEDEFSDKLGRSHGGLLGGIIRGGELNHIKPHHVEGTQLRDEGDAFVKGEPTRFRGADPGGHPRVEDVEVHSDIDWTPCCSTKRFSHLRKTTRRPRRAHLFSGP
jgi:hypothetical protein